MVMMMRANQISQGTSNGFESVGQSGVSPWSRNTSGAQMAAVLRQRGLKDSQYTTTGTFQKLVQSLDKGQTVPFGVVRCEGPSPVSRVVVERSEARGLAISTTASGGSGHWVLWSVMKERPRPERFHRQRPRPGN